MKLPNWMHCKSRQTSIKPFKDFTTGKSYACSPVQSLLDDQQYYPKPSYNYADSRQTQEECQKTSSELKTKRVEEVYEEESSTMNSELFMGFLTIGTLGSEPITTEPSTPTFTMPPMPTENITEKETEVTQNELKLINDELEKFLEAEVKMVCTRSLERSSHVSITTLSDEQIEGVDTEYGDTTIYPLQEYLFGSSIEPSKSSMEVKKVKTTLGELFKRNNTAYEHSTEKCDKEDNQAKGKYGIHFMKKMLKKLYSSPTSSKATAGNERVDSVSIKRKLAKVRRMFSNKIHPERPTAEKEFSKSCNYDINNTFYGGGYNNEELALHNNDNRQFLNRAITEKGITKLNLTHSSPSSSGSNQNREHWIKTDADFLVLEL